jgi:putative DNA methylase
LGLDVTATDLNPVAVLICKALVELPARFSGRAPIHPAAEIRNGAGWVGAHGLAEDVRRYGAWMRDQARARIGHLYPDVTLPDGRSAPVIAWLWARTITCPNPACEATMPLISTYRLATKPGKKRWLAPEVDRTAKRVTFAISSIEPEGPAIKDQRGSSFRCLVCGEVTAKDYAREQGRAGRMGTQLVAVVADAGRSRAYFSATDADLALASVITPTDVPQGAIAEEALGVRVFAYGLTRWADLFTPRQLMALTELTDLVDEARERAIADGAEAAYADAIATYLALIVSRMTDYSSTLAVWASNPQMEMVVHTFGRQALPMTWDFAESNPLGKTSGSIAILTEAVAKALERLPASGVAVVDQLDATTTVRPSHDALVSTDPPYYDNIGYADLSDFFYIWLRRPLERIYPTLFSTLLTPKREELVATPFRHGGRREAEIFFEEGLFGSFARMREAQHPDYPLTVFYAFKQTETAGDGAVSSTGWDTMLSALLDAGFSITGTWPVRTEKPGRMRDNASAALASSIVLVCRPRPDDAPLATRREFVGALRGELPDALRTLQQGNIAPVDLAQAAIGPGMAVFSRYARVVETDGSPMTVRTALGLINQALDEILAEQEGDFDADTRFAVTWFEQFGMDEANFGQADVLARAKNTSVGGMVDDMVLAQRGSKVRLLRRDELPQDWNPTEDSRFTTWEATQHLVRLLDAEGETAAATLLRQLGGGFGERAKELAYRLYTICDRRGWMVDAVAYNALVVAWPDIARQVAGTPEAQGQQSLESQQTLGI